MSETFRQDMPPEAGYPTFNWRRSYPKAGFFTPGRFVLFGAVLPTFYAFFYNLRNYRQNVKNESFEDADVYNALEPFMMAERDRQMLRIMKRNREMEDEVMSDVPGWKTGTWYGEPVYFTLGDKWIEPHSIEINAHLHYYDQAYNSLWRHTTYNHNRTN